MAQIAGLGHVGIFVQDLMKMRDFYTRVIGLQVADEDWMARECAFSVQTRFLSIMSLF